MHTLSSVQGIRDRLFTRLFILNALETGTIVFGTRPMASRRLVPASDQRLSVEPLSLEEPCLTLDAESDP